VHVRLRAPDNIFFHQLSFVDGPGGWQIISNAWHLESTVYSALDPSAELAKRSETIERSGHLSRELERWPRVLGSLHYGSPAALANHGR
jgi:hypothetical protein